MFRNDEEIDLQILGRLFLGYTALKNEDIYVPYTKCRDVELHQGFSMSYNAKRSSQKCKFIFSPFLTIEFVQKRRFPKSLKKSRSPITNP